MHNPGQDGSFALGQMSMGAGAVSGGPVFLPRRSDTKPPPDELLGLNGDAFHSGSDAEKIRKGEKAPHGGRLGSIFGRRESKTEERSAADIVGDQQDRVVKEKQMVETSVEEEGGSAEHGKKKRGLSGLFHHREK